MKKSRVGVREDNILEIIPIKRRLKQALNKSFNEAFNKPKLIQQPLPLDATAKPLFTVRNAIPVFSDEDNTTVSGVLIYAITPDNWSLVYCHTANLNGYETITEQDDNGKEYQVAYSDYYDIPYENITEHLGDYIGAMIDQCDDHLVQHPNMSQKKAAALIQTMEQLSECSSSDFYVDIYIPPKTCDLTGERYLRPGEQYAKTFKNPLFDSDYTTPKGLLAYLHKVISKEIPQHGLKTTYDVHVEILNKFKPEDTPDTAQAPEERRPQSPRAMYSERKKFFDHERRPQFRRYS